MLLSSRLPIFEYRMPASGFATLLSPAQTSQYKLSVLHVEQARRLRYMREHSGRTACTAA